MKYRIKEIAEACEVSVATIRNYEKYGLIPKPQRTKNNYRIYTRRHINYMKCTLSMRAGFSRQEIADIMKHIEHKDVNYVLLQCASKQRNLMNALDQALKTMHYLNNSAFTEIFHISKPISIHRVAEMTDVPKTTLRHWEKEGLIQPLRNSTNHYRYYNSHTVTQIMIIKVIRSAVWSLEEVRKVLNQFKDKHPDTITKMTQDAIQYLYQLNIHQHQGIHALYDLLLKEHLVDDNYQHDYTFNTNISI